MYNRLIPTDSTSKWNFSLYQPDVVVINLLQNDTWLVNLPEHEEFKKRFGGQQVEYGRFIYTIKPILYFIGKLGLKIIAILKK